MFFWGFLLGGEGRADVFLSGGFGFLAGNLRLLLQQSSTSFKAAQHGLPI